MVIGENTRKLETIIISKVRKSDYLLAGLGGFNSSGKPLVPLASILALRSAIELISASIPFC